MAEKYNLNWHTFKDHLLETIHSLLSSKQFADVTLVCDDNIKVRAHSFVLSACSSVFSNLFLGESQTNATVFLKGINHHDLESILEFMYLGKTNFYENRMHAFLEASKGLQVKEICENVEDLARPTSSLEIQESMAAYVEHGVKSVSPIENQEVMAEQVNIFPHDASNQEESVASDTSSQVPNSTKSNVCPECNKIFYDSSNMKKHFEVVHQRITYACDQCDTVVKYKQKLTEHIKSVHEGQRFKCDYSGCDKEYPIKLSLRTHIKAKHENLRFLCKECDFQATTKSHLKTHIEINHVGIRHECNDCKKQFTSKQHLRIHYITHHDMMQ